MKSGSSGHSSPGTRSAEGPGDGGASTVEPEAGAGAVAPSGVVRVVHAGSNRAPSPRRQRRPANDCFFICDTLLRGLDSGVA